MEVRRCHKREAENPILERQLSRSRDDNGVLETLTAVGCFPVHANPDALSVQ